MLDSPINSPKQNEDTTGSKELFLKEFDNLDVCSICQLRFSGTDFKDFDMDNSPPQKEGLHCCVCLGILERDNLTSLAQQIAESLLTSCYDSSVFNMGITVPQCVILRQASLKAHLADCGHKLVDEVPAVKDTARVLLFKLIGKLTNKTQDKSSQLLLKFNWKHANDMKELAGITSLLKGSRKHNTKRNAKGKVINAFTTDIVQNLVNEMSAESVKKYTPCPPHGLPLVCKCETSVSHESVFFGGRYNKYSRCLSQTPWFIDGKRKGDNTSVLELIGEPLKKFTRGADIKFQSSGREDIDVRMLGTGRPFAVEIIDPKKTIVTEEELEQLEREINESSKDKVAIQLLQNVTKIDLDTMKKGEEEKSKTYAAKLWCPVAVPNDKIESLNGMADIVLDQKTPIRVLHRRSLAIRPRTVHHLEMKRSGDEEGYYELDLTTQAGTYVKEFVHGDLGRTEPSLRTLLGVPIDILELDVTNVNLDWPLDVVDTNDDDADSPGFLGN